MAKKFSMELYTQACSVISREDLEFLLCMSIVQSNHYGNTLTSLGFPLTRNPNVTEIEVNRVEVITQRLTAELDRLQVRRKR